MAIVNLREITSVTQDQVPAVLTRAATEANRERTTWLQEVGDTCGVPAEDLRTGDTCVWNGRGTSIVGDITKRGKTQFLVECFWKDYNGNWKRSYRVMQVGRVVAVEFDGRIFTTRLTKEEVSNNRKFA